jgi:secreted PhoX family phosphatase
MDDNTAPIYLWVGTKAASTDPDFLKRNGLAKEQGNLYTWVPSATSSIGKDLGTAGVPDSADLANFGLGKTAAGSWVLVGKGTEVADWNQATLLAKANEKGALQLSRLEDVNINPLNGQQVVFATTGNSAFGGTDTFGNLITLDLATAFNANGLIGSTNTTSLKVIYDGDSEIKSWDLAKGNKNGVIDTGEQAAFGATIIRNPDGLTWSKDGSIYVQEDRSVASGFFATQEASIWKVSPTAKDSITGQAGSERWLQIDRTAVPTVYGQSDPKGPKSSAPDPGNWESSGIIDVSHIYGKKAGNMFLADVQAHSLTNGNLNGSGYLVEGGQLNLIQNNFAF